MVRQARILIANLMLKTADILILDEPTNDLDIPSLEVLEESLDDFPGAVILVTHDRLMLDSVSKIRFLRSMEKTKPNSLWTSSNMSKLPKSMGVAGGWKVSQTGETDEACRQGSPELVPLPNCVSSSGCRTKSKERSGTKSRSSRFAQAGICSELR